MHDDGSSGHTHTNHTPDRKVRAGQEDKTRNAQGQEHSGRSLLQDI